MDAALQHVERACVLLQSDPMGAGQLLLALRNDPEAVSIARHVLEHSSMPAAHFHATGLLQAALLGRWIELPLDERAAARNYLATLLLTHGDRYASFVTSQLLQTFAVLWKRGWAEEGAEGKMHFFQQVQALTQQAKQGQHHHHHQQNGNGGGGAGGGAGQDEIVLASKFILALVGEFSTAKSAALGLPLEFHRQAHKAFETYGLLPCLELGMGMMAEVVEGVLSVTTPAGGGGGAAATTAGERAEVMLARLDAVVQLCVEILSWDFGAFDPLHEPSSTAPSFISPPITWRPFLLKLELFEALIEVYIRIRSFPPSGLHQREQEARTHALRQLLTQHASFQGPIFPNGEERGRYAAFWVRAGVELLSQSMEGAMAAAGGVSAAGRAEEMERFGPEIVALASFLQVCVSNFRLPVLATFSFFPDLCQRLSEVACRLLSVTAGMALEFRGADGDWTEVCEDGWAMEAFELLLEAWGVLVGEPGLDLLGEGGGENSPPLGPVGEGGGKLDGSYGKGGREYDLVATRRVIVEAATPIYQAYQTCRVTLSRVEAARSVEVEEDEDDVAVAEMGTQEQMTGMAAMGRLAPPTALMFLKHLLLDPPAEGGTEGGGEGGCFLRLHMLLTAGGGGGGGGGGGVDWSPTGVAALMEEVRVLVQALGFLVADDFSGEQPAIPESIHRLCFQSTSYSPPSLLASSSSLSSSSSSSSHSPESTSALLVETCGQVQLLATFLLQRAIQDPNDAFLSPYLTEAVLWFLTRWARTYVLPDTRLYRNGILAPPLLQAFGGEAGQQQVEGLLRLAWGFLTHWHSENDVAEAAIALLRAVLLTGGGALGPAALRCETWRVILAAMEAECTILLQQQAQSQQQQQQQQQQNGLGHGHSNGQQHHQQQHPPHIPPEMGYIRLRPDVRGELLEVIVGGVLYRENDPEAPRALMQVANPLETRLQHVLLKLSSAAATAPIKGNATAATTAARVRAALAQEIGEVADLYAGLAKAVDQSGLSLLAGLVTRALEPLVGAATQCGPYPETMHVVLKFLRNYAEVHISSLGAEATMALLRAAGQALKAYAAHNLGRTRKDANSKEEAMADMLCVLELLSYLATKDFIDFSAEHEGKVAADTVADVVFFGLERVIPLMTEDFLDFPPLGKQYFTLVNSMVSTYTGRVALLPHPLFMQLVQSVIFGVQRPDSEIARDSLRALAGLASFHAKAGQTAQNGGGEGVGLSVHVAAHPALLSDCMHKLLHMVVYEGSIWDRLDAASNALLALVLCDRDAFLRMVHGILEPQPPSVKDRLQHEFEEMIKAIPPPQAPQAPQAGGGGKGRGVMTDRQTKLAFRDRLKQFAKRVRPFMQMR